MDNFNPQNPQNFNHGEMEKIIAQREKKRYLEELSELETSEASAQSKIFWTAISLLIIEPAATAGIIFYFWDQFKILFGFGGTNQMATNFWTNIKYAAIIIAVTFLGSSLSLLYNLWRVSSLKSQIAKLKGKINRL